MSEGRAQGFQAGALLGGRYLLERPLGAGGMGSVWVGRQIALEREVAVKVLHGDGGPPSSQLRREALALAAVHHPAVVQVFDYGETDEGVPYVVMELVRGEPLADLIQRGGPLRAEEAVALLLPLLDGLTAVHQAGIVHRDIKPENVIVTRGPRGVVPKLLDFGIARRDQGGPMRTSGGALVGTPPYMAPEQVRSRGTDARTDVWGAGALLYTLIAGDPPFGVDDAFEIMRRIIDQPPPYPRQARGLDGKLWAILTGALRKDPDDRTPSAEALREALARWHAARGGAPVTRGAVSAVSPAGASPASLALTLPADEAPPADDGEAPSIDRLIRAKLGAD